MSSYNYLRITMQRLANLIYNSTQGNSITKDDIIDSLKRTIEDYNSKIDDKERIKVEDFRKK